jgi:hypothetical protein
LKFFDCSYDSRTVLIFKQKRKDELVKTFNEKQERVETNIILLENLQKRIRNEKEVLKVALQQATPVQVMVETKKLKGKQEQHIKTVLESYEQSKNFNLLFNRSTYIIYRNSTG